MIPSGANLGMNRGSWKNIGRIATKALSAKERKGKYVDEKKRKSKVVQKKLMPKGNKVAGNKSAAQKLVQRSAMKVTGKNKLKTIEDVTVSPYLRLAVNKINRGKDAYGDYTEIRAGWVGTIQQAFGNASSFTLSGLSLGSTAVLAHGPAGPAAAGGRSMFGALINYQPALGTAPVLIAGTNLEFFTPAKILNAASVLWNQKAPVINGYEVTPNNLSTLYNPTTGVESNANAGSLKVNVMNSYVQFELKNVSDRPVHCVIWECTPKLKFGVQTPIQDIANVEVIAQSNAGQERRTQLFGNITSLSETHVDPFKFNVPSNWTIKKRDMVLAPDEQCNHSIQGPKGILDYQKLFNAGVSQQSLLLKKWSVACVIGIYPEVVKPLDSTAGGTGGALSFQGNATAQMGCPVHVKMVERFKLSVPEIVGSIKNTNVLDATQLINARKERITVVNFIPEVGLRPYLVSNEVNPVAEVAGSGAN